MVKINRTAIGAIIFAVIVVGAAVAYVWFTPPKEIIITPPPEEHKILITFLSERESSWNKWQAEGLIAVGKAAEYEVEIADHVSAADFVRVATGYIEEGYDVIIGGAYEFQQPVLQMADQHPNVSFLSYGASEFAPNTAGYNTWPHEGFYLAGQVAGLMTSTGTIGYVDAFKYPYDLSAWNGFAAGVKSVNENATVLEAWVGTWTDPAKGLEAANAMMDDGADVLIHDASGPGYGMLQAVKLRDKFAIGAYVDQSYLGDYILTSVANEFEEPLKVILRDIDEGKFGGKSYDFTMKEGGVDLSPFSDRVQQEVIDKVMDTREKIIKGLVHVPFVPS